MKRASIILSLLAALLSSACDPGIDYSPKDWSNANEYNFIRKFGPIDLEIARVGGFIGSRSMMPAVVIHNHAKSPAVIERAILKANGLEYAAQSSGKGWEPVPPDSARHTVLYWTFDKTIEEILKDPVEITLTIKIGDERTEIRIPMVKTLG